MEGVGEQRTDRLNGSSVDAMAIQSTKQKLLFGEKNTI